MRARADCGDSPRTKTSSTYGTKTAPFGPTSTPFKEADFSAAPVSSEFSWLSQITMLSLSPVWITLELAPCEVPGQG